jgi:hypothetical protein
MKRKKINFKFNQKVLATVAVAIGLIGLIYFFKSQFVVGWVNGRPISRVSYNRELEKIAKNQAFDSLTTKALIMGEAKKQNIKVEQKEIDEAMNNIQERAKQQGTTLDELLVAQGVTRATVEEEVKLQKMLEKLVGPADVSEEEIQAYWDQNKELYGDQKFEDVQADIADQLLQQAMIGKIQELITRLQTEANIVKW